MPKETDLITQALAVARKKPEAPSFKPFTIKMKLSEKDAAEINMIHSWEAKCPDMMANDTTGNI